MKTCVFVLVMNFEKFWCVGGANASKCQGLCVPSPDGAQCLCTDNSSDTDHCVQPPESKLISKCPKGCFPTFVCFWFF